MTLGPEAWQDYRSLPSPDTYERKQAYGNLQSLLMTFTISPAFLPCEHAVVMAMLRKPSHPTSSWASAWLCHVNLILLALFSNRTQPHKGCQASKRSPTYATQNAAGGSCSISQHAYRTKT